MTDCSFLTRTRPRAIRTRRRSDLRKLNLGLAAALGLATLASRPAAAFDVLWAAVYRQNPDLSACGIDTGTGGVVTLYESDLWPAGADRTNPNTTYLRNTVAPRVKALSPQPKHLVLDIERWNAPAQMWKYGTALSTLRTALGAAKPPNVGKFELPFPVYGFVGATWDSSAQWRQSEQSLYAAAGAYVDALYPSLYDDVGPDLATWKKEANLLLSDAKLRGKKAYVFLWPYYADWGPTQYRKTLVDPAQWRAQLDYLKATGWDGAIIWHSMWEGYGQDWNPNAGWWQQTKAFMGEPDCDTGGGGTGTAPDMTAFIADLSKLQAVAQAVKTTADLSSLDTLIAQLQTELQRLEAAKAALAATRRLP